jgi:hypothetical protein
MSALAHHDHAAMRSDFGLPDPGVKFADILVRPDTIVAGGLTWTADRDDTAYGPVIGWALAVEQGVANVPRTATPTTSAQDRIAS